MAWASPKDHHQLTVIDKQTIVIRICGPTTIVSGRRPLPSDAFHLVGLLKRWSWRLDFGTAETLASAKP